jgi:hypothetical protein
MNNNNKLDILNKHIHFGKHKFKERCAMLAAMEEYAVACLNEYANGTMEVEENSLERYHMVVWTPIDASRKPVICYVNEFDEPKIMANAIYPDEYGERTWSDEVLAKLISLKYVEDMLNYIAQNSLVKYRYDVRNPE